MDRATVVGGVLVLAGVWLVATAPPDPQYSVSVYGPTEALDDEPVVAYENLSENDQELFRQALSDGYRSPEPPDIEAEYVRYESEVYEVLTAAHEGSVFSLLLPPLGGLLALVGTLVLAYSRLYRS